MNLNVLACMSVLAVTLVSSQSRAADLWTLLGTGETTLPGGDVVYTLRGPGHLSVMVGATFGQIRGDGYTSLNVRTFKFTGPFTTNELQLFTSNVIRLSVECFNIDAARAPAIQAWILANDAREENMYYTAGTKTSARMFGPLRLELEKRSNGQGHAVSVWFSRSGTPRQAPWIKSCVASG